MELEFERQDQHEIPAQRSSTPRELAIYAQGSRRHLEDQSLRLDC